MNRVAEMWMQEEKDICFHVYKSSVFSKKSNSLGEAIKINNKTSKTRRKDLCESIKSKQIIESEFLNSKFKIQSKLTVDFKGTKAYISCAIAADPEKKSIGQITAILKKLDKCGLEDLIEIGIKYGKEREKYCSLKKLQDEREGKFKTYNHEAIRKTESISKFVVKMSLDYNKSEFYNPKKFIQRIEQLVVNFFEQAVTSFLK